MSAANLDYKKKLFARMSERILILDGAMGTMIQKKNLSEAAFGGKRGNNDLLNLTSPDIIEEIHKEYIESGADIITTNTFSGNAISQQEYGCTERVYEINRRGAEIARKAAAAYPEREIIVAGSMGPTTKLLSFSPDVNNPMARDVDFDTMCSAYMEQARALLDGGVDLLLIETIIDGLNAKAALYAIRKIYRERNIEKPIILSATINDKSGRLLNGQTLESLYTSISGYNPAAFGLNCSFGAKELLPFIKQISDELFLGNGVECPVILYPNAGLPNAMGQYDETPQYTAECIREVAEKGVVNIVGGCCGTTPEHIKAIKDAVTGVAPRPLRTKEKEGLWVAGLEAALIDKSLKNFVNVGERTNVAGSAKFARLIREGAYAEAAEIARKQIEDGATIIDINMDDAMLESSVEMGKFIRYISNDPEIAKVPFMIDSSHWETIVAGLKNSAGKCIVNSLSLKEGEEEFIAKATEVLNLGAALIVMAFDEKGQAVTFEHKIEICRRAYNILTEKAGYKPHDIIFDVNILSVATGIEEHNDYAVNYIKAVRWIKENLPGCKTSGGVSNLSFSFRGNNRVREAMHSVFLYHAINAGLDMAIVNPSMLQVYDQIEPKLLSYTEAVIQNDKTLLKEDAEKYASPTDALIELAQEIKEEELALKEAKSATGSNLSLLQSKREKWREEPLKERIAHALIKGISDYIQQDMEEAMLTYKSPIGIIQGPLMEAMERVGNLFGAGKMFLPQVVKSAKVMRDAVTVLTPYMEAEKGENGKNGENGENGEKGENGKNGRSYEGTIVLATAKGDVHDIGKNIVSIVLSCNNFNVIDLGVMVDNETILEEAIKAKADIVGISGLITPSLEQMVNLCKLMEREKGRILKEVGHPIAITVGGATTSSVHTAVKLAPLYSHCVAHALDASKAATICKKIISEQGYIDKIKLEEQKIREAYYSNTRCYSTLEEAREAAPHFPLSSFVQSNSFGENNIKADIAIKDLMPFIDWTPFFNFWGFKGKYPELLYKEEADELFLKANELLAGDWLEVKAMLSFFDAYSDKEELNILENLKDEPEKEQGLYTVGTRKPTQTLKVPRQLEKNSRHLCITDFFPQAPYTSKVGLLVVKAEDMQADGLDHKGYEYLLRQSLCARVAEAAAEYLTAIASDGERVIRAAIGYDMIPDHSYKERIFKLTGATEKLGVTLTENYAIMPTTSICALLIAHKEAEYFDIK